MKTIGIIFNSEKPEALRTADSIKKAFSKKPVRVVIVSSEKLKKAQIDIAIAVGGDGTILKASEFLAQKQIPVLGVNVGSLGFLVETNPSEFKMFCDKIVKGNFNIESRMMLKVELVRGKKKNNCYALNECMIHSGNSGRVTTVLAHVNKKLLGNYIGDGLIVSTPTGSTAYSLAASGPIVYPSLSLFTVTPVCPHTLAQRPIIIPTEGNTISLSAQTKINTKAPVLTIDGQRGFPLSSKDEVRITVSPRPLLLITNPRRDYFRVLRTKLKWGERG